jgi:hypothetical protein
MVCFTVLFHGLPALVLSVNEDEDADRQYTLLILVVNKISFGPTEY